VKPRALLTVLQLGDSFFPSGASVFSYGVEGMRELGGVRGADDVARFVRGQLEHRWAGADRVAVFHAHAATDLPRLAQIDRFVDASTLVESWRVGGRRLGRSLLRVHTQLGLPEAQAYAALRAPAQACVVQGLIARARGLGSAEALSLSGYGLVQSLVGASLRLGLLGHLDAQRILMEASAQIAARIAEPVPALEAYASWVPEAELASMYQEARHGRLFAS
jgi:urease accessory protein